MFGQRIYLKSLQISKYLSWFSLYVAIVGNERRFTPWADSGNDLLIEVINQYPPLSEDTTCQILDILFEGNALSHDTLRATQTFTLLSELVKTGRFKALTQALSFGIIVTSRNEGGWTILHDMDIGRGLGSSTSSMLLSFLLSNQFDLGSLDNHGHTVLHFAAGGWKEELLTLLLEKIFDKIVGSNSFTFLKNTLENNKIQQEITDSPDFEVVHMV